MGKPESAGAKSLEEILASIRKTLAEEGADGPNEPKSAEAKVAQAAGQPTPSGNVHVDGTNLSGKLAGALNRPSTANSSPLDDDLADLLAAETQKGVPPP